MKLKFQLFLAFSIVCSFWALSSPAVLADSELGRPAVVGIGGAPGGSRAGDSRGKAVIPASSGGLAAGVGSANLPSAHWLRVSPERLVKPVIYLPVIFTAEARQPEATPQTGLQPAPSTLAAPQSGVEADPRLAEFIEAVKNLDRKGLAVGLYSPDILAFSVVQQPSNNPIFVSTKENQVTQFRRAARAGSLGLLAHNYLAGRSFFELQMGARLYVIQWDGSYQAYEIYAIEDYQALTLTTFRAAADGKYFDQYALFDRVYRADNDRLVLQTCLEKGGNLSWGRRFILARPVPVIQ